MFQRSVGPNIILDGAWPHLSIGQSYGKILNRDKYERTDLITKAEYKISTLISLVLILILNLIFNSKVSALIKAYCRRSFVDYVNDAKVEVSAEI